MIETLSWGNVHPEMVDCGSGQNRSTLETAGVAVGDVEDEASLRAQGWENAGLGRKMPFLDGHPVNFPPGSWALPW